MTPARLALAGAVIEGCAAAGLRLATAESCTGGLIAATLTEIPGCSAVVDRGYVAYDNRAKEQMLAVPAALLAEHGAVSEAVARAMAEGARAQAGVDLAIAVTGVAGPGGGSPAKPVGLVHLALASARGTRHECALLSGDRTAIRLATVDRALQMLLDQLASASP
jgi:nicotinamide-nucleotide amidase